MSTNNINPQSVDIVGGRRFIIVIAPLLILSWLILKATGVVWVHILGYGYGYGYDADTQFEYCFILGLRLFATQIHELCYIIYIPVVTCAI